jgi:catechol 2,3-dioxygenase-like lactoylglutathione lyase family enzyme
MRIGLVTLVVRDYDEAIRFFVDALGFALREDTPVGAGKRWVVVEAGRRRHSWTPTTSRPTTSGCAPRGCASPRPPREEAYGTVAVFEDLYGNRWDLIERRPLASTPPEE